MGTMLPKLLYIGQGANSNVYTSSATGGSYTIIKNINLVNTQGGNLYVTMHLVDSGLSAANNNVIISNVLVPANDVVYLNTTIVMPNDASIYYKTSNVTATISGVEFAA